MRNHPPRILLTRPSAQSIEFASLLGDAEVLISPLIEIVQIVVDMRIAPNEALVFTSANGVEAYAAQSRNRQNLCFCVGNRTLAAVQRHGFTGVSADGNAYDLAKMLESNPVPKVHIRGVHSIGALPVERELVVYDQRKLPLSEEALNLLASKTTIICPIFSPRTARIFAAEIAGIDTSRIHAVCISENAAEPLQKLASITVAKNPNAQSVADAIASLHIQAEDD